MIHINRKRNSRNGDPIEPPTSWFASARTATRKAVREGAEHKADNAIYGHSHVRAALEELFHWKCAYCEQSLPEQWDVEHYRPKGRVAEWKGHPGYYYRSTSAAPKVPLDAPPIFTTRNPRWKRVKGASVIHETRKEKDSVQRRGDKAMLFLAAPVLPIGPPVTVVVLAVRA